MVVYSFSQLGLYQHVYYQDYFPSEEDIILSQQRIQEKLKGKPDFYTFYGGNSFT